MNLVLGTAKWGDTVSKYEAFNILDHWYWVHGQHKIDCAINYPINSVPADFGRSQSFLFEYIHKNVVRDLDITMKIGSVNNLRSPDTDFTYIKAKCQQLLDDFGSNLKCIMIHWDNRNDPNEILDTLGSIASGGLRVGISGILNLEVYSKVVNELGLKLDVQVNYLNIASYIEFFNPNFHDYYAYNVKRGDQDYLRALSYGLCDDRLTGILIGPKNCNQLIQTLNL